MKNLTAVLEASGTTMEHVVKVNVFLVDMKDFQDMNSVYTQYFGEEKPCRTYVVYLGSEVWRANITIAVLLSNSCRWEQTLKLSEYSEDWDPHQAETDQHEDHRACLHAHRK